MAITPRPAEQTFFIEHETIPPAYKKAFDRRIRLGSERSRYKYAFAALLQGYPDILPKPLNGIPLTVERLENIIGGVNVIRSLKGMTPGLRRPISVVEQDATMTGLAMSWPQNAAITRAVNSAGELSVNGTLVVNGVINGETAIKLAVAEHSGIQLTSLDAIAAAGITEEAKEAFSYFGLGLDRISLFGINSLLTLPIRGVTFGLREDSILLMYGRERPTTFIDWKLLPEGVNVSTTDQGRLEFAWRGVNQIPRRAAMLTHESQLTASSMGSSPYSTADALRRIIELQSANGFKDRILAINGAVSGKDIRLMEKIISEGPGFVMLAGNPDIDQQLLEIAKKYNVGTRIVDTSKKTNED